MKSARIYKYSLDIHDRQTIDLTEINHVMTIKEDPTNPNKLLMWVMLVPDAPKSTKTFKIFGTGHEIDLTDPEHNDMKYIDTIYMSTGYVWHVFELTTVTHI